MLVVGQNLDWEAVGINLKARRPRLIFVADAIPTELGQIVEHGGERVTLVPRLMGQTESAKRGKSASGESRKWGEADLGRAFRSSYEPDVAERMVALYEFLRDAGARRSWGTGQSPP